MHRRDTDTPMRHSPLPGPGSGAVVDADPAVPAALSRQLLLTVWCPRPGVFAARALLADGTLRDFDSPFELVRFLARPAATPAASPGLR